MLYTINKSISILFNNLLFRYLLILATGALLALTSPYLGFGFYAWLGLVPLILFTKSSKNFSAAALETFLFAFSYNAISFYWLSGIHPLDWLGFDENSSLFLSNLAWILVSIFQSSLLVIFALVLKFVFYLKENRTKELNIWELIFLSFIWVIVIHKIPLSLGNNFNLFSVPSNFLAYSQYQNIYLIQIAKLFGAISIEFLIIFSNLSLSNLINIQNHSHNLSSLRQELNINEPYYGLDNMKESYKYLIAFVGILILVYFFGFYELSKSHKSLSPNKTIKAIIVQTDFDVTATRSESSNFNNILSILNELLKTISYKSDLILFPEAAIPKINKEQWYSVLEDINFHPKQVIYGTYSKADQGGYHNSIEFYQFKDQLTKNYEKNISILFDDALYEKSFFDLELSQKQKTYFKDNQRSTKVLKQYHKEKLVPFGEYTPFYNLLPDSLKRFSSSTVGSGFKAFKENKIISSRDLRIGASICFELLFPDLIRKKVNQGAEMIINTSDLSWFNSWLKGKWLKKQFQAVAVFRALENSRPLLLAANSGFSAAVDKFGIIQKESDQSKIDILHIALEKEHRKSFFTKYGW